MVPLSQDEATEGTMSSEALPLIFEPLEDVTSEGAASETTAAVKPAPGSAQPPAAVPLSEADLDQLDTMETDSDSPSHAPPLLMPDWTSPWQMSGTELQEPIGSPGPSVSPQQARTDLKQHFDRGEKSNAAQ